MYKNKSLTTTIDKKTEITKIDSIKEEVKIPKGKIIPNRILNSFVDEKGLQSNKKLIDVNKLEINNLPSGVKVATMCSSCFLGTIFGSFILFLSVN